MSSKITVFLLRDELELGTHKIHTKKPTKFITSGIKLLRMSGVLSVLNLLAQLDLMKMLVNNAL